MVIIMAFGSVNVPGGTTQGADGKSAYEVAIANGFSGTEAQWLASLKGETGATGGTGAAGATGPAGPGLPPGGTAGQVPVKVDETDYNTQWKTLNAGDVGAAQEGHAHTDYAPKERPVFTGTLSFERNSESTIGEKSIAIGQFSVASQFGTVALGRLSEATASCAIALLSGRASGDSSLAALRNAKSTGKESVAIGMGATTLSDYSMALGANTVTSAQYQLAIGYSNKYSENETDRVLVGMGRSSNCFRITDTGTYANGSYNATGADYAELFEWQDGNPQNEDRIGLFVTLDGEKVRLAKPGDDFILGVVSGNPSVVGDAYDDQWQGMYATDIFGRFIYEDAVIPAEYDEDGNLVSEEHTETRLKINSAYNANEPYVPRSQRREWVTVGMMGKLTVIDDGTCQVNGWCTAGAGGVATASDSRTKYRVMSRLDGNHVRVLIL